MGRYACYRLFCLATLILLTSIGAVDININETTDYDGVHVVLLHKNLYWCYRHVPTNGSRLRRVLIDNVDGPIFITYAPYLDVLIHGATKYFKIENPDWCAATPFIGNKYNYYKVRNPDIFSSGGEAYAEFQRHSYRRHIALNIRRYQRDIAKYRIAEGVQSVPNADVFIRKVNAQELTLWQYEQSKGIIMARALLHNIHMHTVVTLYFLDLNDNEIEMDFMVGKDGASYISPWKGCPKKYDLPPEKLPSPCASPRVEPIPLVVNVTMDLNDTPLLKVRNILQGGKPVNVYTTHPDAYINHFISPLISLPHDGKRIFLSAYRVLGNSVKLQVLLYESDTTTLFEITTERLHNGLVPVADPKIIVYSFPLYLEAQVDERMYTKKCIKIAGTQSVVFTARPHLSFSQVYRNCVAVFGEYEGAVIMEQFILQDSGIYVVIRAANGNCHERYYRGRGETSWQRAKDEYPDYILWQIF